jgi:hypothetical protein
MRLYANGIQHPLLDIYFHLIEGRNMSKFKTIKALVERLNGDDENKSFTDHGIRHYVRNADTNGLAPHITRLGQKILIDEEGFITWLRHRT